MSKFDDRSHDDETKEDFSKAIQIGLLNFHKEYKSLRDKLSGNDICQLDSLKQKGSYSSHFNHKFVIPSSVIDKELCVSINKLANSLSANIRFILNKEVVENFISFSASVRNSYNDVIGK